MSAEGQQAERRTRLRAYAREIRDEAHFEFVMAAIEDPDIRETLRRQLTPLLSFTLTADAAGLQDA